MEVPKIILKSTFLATCIFWLVIFSEHYENFMILLFFLSMIPISICCAMIILLTILPFFRFKAPHIDNKTVFKYYFPYYAIIMFGLCSYGMFKEPELISFFASAYITTMQAWVWFGKFTPTKP